MELKDEHLEGLDDRLPELVKKFNSFLSEEGFDHLKVADLQFRLGECIPDPPCPSGIGEWVRNHETNRFECKCKH